MAGTKSHGTRTPAQQKMRSLGARLRLQPRVISRCSGNSAYPTIRYSCRCCGCGLRIETPIACGGIVCSVACGSSRSTHPPGPLACTRNVVQPRSYTVPPAGAVARAESFVPLSGVRRALCASRDMHAYVRQLNLRDMKLKYCKDRV